MNKIVKRRLIGTIICFVVGTISLTYNIVNAEKIGEELGSYLNGFSSGVMGGALYFLICTIRAIRNPKIAKNMENIEQDERLHSINNKAMAYTFRISVLIEAITSIGSAVLGHMQIAECLGFIICVQLILYVVIYYIVTYKN